MSLNLLYSLNPVSLADSMIDKINGCWNDPFDSPTVIFPDKMVEQWFKLYWLEKGNKALINLRFEKMDQFLFNLLPNEDGAKIISSDLLRLAIIKKLETNYQFDPSESNVKKYIYDNNTVNYNRLYDFAKIMADLLLDYERTRPDWDSSPKEDVNSSSPWYKSEVKLYKALFEDGYIYLNGEKYSTFSQLYRKTGNTFINLSDHKPIFVFGFSGLGETYVNALSTISKSCDVNVYLQADDKDDCPFAVHGKKSLETWKKIANNKERLSGFVHPIEKANKDFIPKFIAAPSKLREIDKLHNEICCLLENENDAPMLKDIKVFAPNIKDYIPEISLVFDQKVKQRSAGDMAIPYSISDYSAKTSCIYEAVDILFRIIEKGDFSRADFIKLIKNPVVQATRGISEDAVDNWTNWIKEINVYRKSNWESAKKRLLFAKLSFDPVDGVNPYDPIGSDDTLIFKFIEMVEELGKWAQMDSENKVDDYREFLRSMLSIGRVKDKSLDGERAVYLSVMGAIRNLEKVYGDNEINYKVVFLTVQDSIKGVSLSTSGDAKGIEFISFRPGRVIPANYTFFIGMDSESFPGPDQRNALDIRKESDDEKASLRNTNSLYCQIEATNTKVQFSYVNKDLKKDEDFYKSSVLKEIAKLLGRTKENNEIEDEVKVDANWLIQFTPRNKRDNSIFKENDNESALIHEKLREPEPPTKVSVSQLRRYLEEPLKFQIETAFGYGDEDIEIEEAEFEPVSLDNLTMSDLRKKYVKQQKKAVDIRADLTSRGYLPEDVFGENQIELLSKEVENVNNSINEFECIESFSQYLKTDLQSVQDTVIHQTKGNGWTLSGLSSYCNVDYLNTKQIIAVDTSGFSNAYATALAILSEVADGLYYSIDLYVLDINNRKWSKLEVANITRDFAIKKLDSFFFEKWAENWQKQGNQEDFSLDNLNSPEMDNSRPKSIKVSSFVSFLDFKLFLDCYSDKSVVSYSSGRNVYKGYSIDNNPVSLSKADVSFVSTYMKEYNGVSKMGNGLSCPISVMIEKYREKCSSFNIDCDEYQLHSLNVDMSIIFDSVLTAKESTFKHDDKEYRYSLFGDTSFYYIDHESKRLFCVDLKNNLKLKDFLNGYVSSMAILSTCDNWEEYSISLCLISPKNGKIGIRHYFSTKGIAKQILDDIYSDAYIDKRQYFLPIELLETTDVSYEDIIEEAYSQNGSWEYFRKSRIVEIPDGLGYQQSSFTTQWDEYRSRQAALISNLLKKED